MTQAENFPISVGVFSGGSNQSERAEGSSGRCAPFVLGQVLHRPGFAQSGVMLGNTRVIFKGLKTHTDFLQSASSALKSDRVHEASPSAAPAPPINLQTLSFKTLESVLCCLCVL